jgi:hypothetical protein
VKHVQRLVNDLAVTRIGRMTPDRSMLVSRNGSTEPLPSGFVHFS